MNGWRVVSEHIHAVSKQIEYVGRIPTPIKQTGIKQQPTHKKQTVFDMFLKTMFYFVFFNTYFHFAHHTVDMIAGLCLARSHSALELLIFNSLSLSSQTHSIFPFTQQRGHSSFLKFECFQYFITLGNSMLREWQKKSSSSTTTKTIKF